MGPRARWIGVVLAVAGLAIVLVAVLADQIGLGSGAGGRFGPRQAIGAAVGAVLLLAGLATFLWALRANRYD